MSNGKILSFISICIGTIVGIISARYVPSSFIIEVSLAVGVALLVMHLVRREKSSRKSLPTEMIFKHNVDDDDSNEWTTPSVVPSECTAKAEESLDTLSISASSDISTPPIDTENIIPNQMEERNRSCKTSSSYLHFVDTKGRKIKYTLRTRSNKTILELLVEGKRARKVKQIIYDDSLHIIRDGRNIISIQKDDTVTVMKCLQVLCKVGGVQLDVINASSQLRKVLSNLDFGRRRIRQEYKMYRCVMNGCKEQSRLSISSMYHVD